MTISEEEIEQAQNDLYDELHLRDMINHIKEAQKEVNSIRSILTVFHKSTIEKLGELPDLVGFHGSLCNMLMMAERELERLENS